MEQLENNIFFWQNLDTLYLSSACKIDRPKGTHHYKYANLVYPVDYGFLSDTMDSGQPPIDVYRGSRKTSQVDALVVSADILRKDCKAKLLIGCTEKEVQDILTFLNQTEFQKAILVRRGTNIPDWTPVD